MRRQVAELAIGFGVCFSSKFSLIVIPAMLHIDRFANDLDVGPSSLLVSSRTFRF